MSDLALIAKKAYFKNQELLDLTDDEVNVVDTHAERIEQALFSSKSQLARPPGIVRQSSSFCGPTPKERQQSFEAYSTSRRVASRGDEIATQHFDAESTRQANIARPNLWLQRNRSDSQKPSLSRLLSKPPVPNEIPFYKRMGVVPRELKSGKNVKPAENIKLDSEQKQLLQGDIVYFYPNDDISMARRRRIHKVIQLGAAWVNRWREDVTHIMLDDDSTSYSQLLRHLNMAGLPKRVQLVKFDPYIPQCIQFGALLDPNTARFVVKGAPRSNCTSQATYAGSNPSSSGSLHIKPSYKQLAAQASIQTESHTCEELPESSQPLGIPGSIERVKDSFVTFSSEGNKQSGAVNESSGNDVLSQAIKEALATAHLPLDDEEDLMSPLASTYQDDTDTDEEALGPAFKASDRGSLVSKASALRDKKGPNQNQFQCMQPSRGVTSTKNPNAHTIQILEEMGRYYDQIQDTWRTLAYRKAVTTLKKQTVKITSAAQAGSLPFIGSRLADKIEEIVLTSHLRKLDETRNDPLDACLRLFLGIYGVGIVQANKWVSSGYRSLEDLQNKAKLSESQKIGIEHYTDFNSRIPRSEVADHGALVQAALRKLDPRFEATVMGSYRRGAKDSGDIDMIITRPGASLAVLRNTVFMTLIPHLFAIGFLKASLASRSSNDSTGSKWHGASCLPSSTVWRRMDFLLVPEEELGAALIYFTGNDIFNRSIRLLARKNGMRLNQKGLYKDVARGKKGEKLNEGLLVEGKSERRIFDILGVPWREPVERIC